MTGESRGRRSGRTSPPPLSRAAAPGSVSGPLPSVLERSIADRQLIAGAITVIFVARLVDGPASWLVAGVLGLGVLIGVCWNRPAADAAPEASARVSSFRLQWEAVAGGASGMESGIVPAVLAAALALSLRLVPFDWRFVATLAGALVLLDRSIRFERSFARSTDDSGERWQVVLMALATAFLGFAGVAAMVRGGVADAGGPTLAEQDLLLLAGGDAVVGLLLGFRLARLGPAARREALVSGVGFGALVAIGSGLLRAMAIPALLGPALLTLLVYLWDALNATTPSIRRDPRWRWQVGLLLLLSAVVITWNLRLRA